MLLSGKALAQSETSYDLINAVNALRALHGLEPYQIDPWLMDYAKEHAEYQARIQTSTHQHSDGSRPLDHGLGENVAAGHEGVVTVAIVVYEIWSDWGHRHTLVGYSSGQIGAGVALSENGLVYYSVNIRPGTDAVTVTPGPESSDPFIPLVTSTPNQDGVIVHVVRPGETLWGIAQSYGVTIDDIRNLNLMAPDASIIYIGQELLIGTSVITPPAFPNEAPIMANPTDDIPAVSDTAVVFTIDTDTPTPSITVIPSPASTEVTNGKSTKHPTGNRSILLLAVLVVGIIGLLITRIFGFTNSGENQNSKE